MKIKKGVILQQMGDTFVAFDNETSTIHELNETAFFVLNEINKNSPKGKIIEKVIKDYGVDKSKAQKDVDLFINLLFQKKLVV